MIILCMYHILELQNQQFSEMEIIIKLIRIMIQAQNLIVVFIRI